MLIDDDDLAGRGVYRVVGDSSSLTGVGYSVYLDDQEITFGWLLPNAKAIAKALQLGWESKELLPTRVPEESSWNRWGSQAVEARKWLENRGIATEDSAG